MFKLYALDLFGNVINLLHLYANKQASKQADEEESVYAGQLNGYRIDFIPNDRHSYLYMGDILLGQRNKQSSQQTYQTNTQYSALIRILICMRVCAVLLLFNGKLKSISNEYMFVVLETECKLPICNILDTWQIGNEMCQCCSVVDWVFVLFHFDAFLPTPNHSQFVAAAASTTIPINQ